MRILATGQRLPRRLENVARAFAPRLGQRVLQVSAVAGMIGCLIGAEPDAKSARSSADFGDVTLEQLANIQVTPVTKRQTPLDQSPAAISVITQEDIRRSGLTTLPELLRLAPMITW